MKHFVIAVLSVWATLSSGEHFLLDPIDESIELEARSALSRATRFLLESQQADGSWDRNPGVTAFCLLALVEAEHPDQASQAKAAAYVEAAFLRRPEMLRVNEVYEASAALMALHAVGPTTYAKTITALRLRLLATQPQLWTRQQQTYGTQSRQAYISDIHWVIEACSRDGLDPMLSRRAQHYTLLCQVSDESEEQGAFAYSPTALENRLPEQVWIQGSFTTCGVKTLLHCGVAADDPRVQHALSWLARDLSCKDNPRAGDAGYYSYLYSAASLFEMLYQRNALRLEYVDLPKKVTEALLARQRASGGWQNKSQLWREGSPALCTAYATLSMSLALRNSALD